MKIAWFTTFLLVLIHVSGMDAGGGKWRKEVSSLQSSQPDLPKSIPSRLDILTKMGSKKRQGLQSTILSYGQV